jgi:hypothetical protein
MGTKQKLSTECIVQQRPVAANRLTRLYALFVEYNRKYSIGLTIGAREAQVAHERKGDRTMTTIQIELPDATVKAARDAGLLTPQALERILNDALERKRASDFLMSLAERVAAAGLPPMSMEEINAEVKAARAERKQRASGS